jgi:hypothetical protein
MNSAIAPRTATKKTRIAPARGTRYRWSHSTPGGSPRERRREQEQDDDAPHLPDAEGERGDREARGRRRRRHPDDVAVA